MIIRFLVLLVLMAVPAAAETPSRGIVEISDGDETLTFQVEIADESDEISQGLMFRSSLAPRSGMLFLYPHPRIASFWMKNTIISLDILFVDIDRRVVKIAARTEPYSLEPISSEKPVVAVLEIEGGSAKTLGIEEGDRLRWIVFPPRD